MVFSAKNAIRFGIKQILILNRIKKAINCACAINFINFNDIIIL